MEFEYDGFDQLIQEIESLEKVTKDVQDEALIAAGDVLVENMQSQVYAHGLQRRSGTGQASIGRTNPKNGELFVGPSKSGFYLYMHEFGFFNVRAGRFIGPKPFASIAFNQATSKMLDEQIKILRRGMGMF